MFWSWLGLKARYLPLPEQFYCSDTGKPFERCLVCDAHLLENNLQYMIERAVRQHREYGTQDIVFEYAICMGCYQDLSQEFSEDSRKRIERFMKQNVSMPKRWRRFQKSEAGLVDYLNSCFVKGTPSEELDEYQLVLHCEGKHLVMTFMPYLISGNAMNEIATLLSNETLGQIDDFSDRFLGLPPELKDLLKDRPVLV